MTDTVKFVIALIVALIVLKAIEAQAPKWAGAYVVVILLGMVLVQRQGVTAFLSGLTSRLKVGG